MGMSLRTFLSFGTWAAVVEPLGLGRDLRCLVAASIDESVVTLVSRHKPYRLRVCAPKWVRARERHRPSRLGDRKNQRRRVPDRHELAVLVGYLGAQTQKTAASVRDRRTSGHEAPVGGDGRDELHAQVGGSVG
jgi:hypothetical protein